MLEILLNAKELTEMAKVSTAFQGLKRKVTTHAKRTVLRTAPKPLIHRLRRLRTMVRRFRIEIGATGEYPEVSTKNKLATPPVPPHSPYKVGFILDEFSQTAWGPEFDLVPIMPGTPVPESIDFLFVEAAWSGNGGAWKHQLVGANSPSSELKEIVENCRRRGIPTLFWNKEDPPHFEDFLNTAGLFDYIATTDSSKVAEYEQRFPKSTVFTLPFAAQPAVQNPARNSLAGPTGDIAFAGTYFRHKFDSRRVQMDLLLGAAHRIAQRTDFTFTIFSRHAGGSRRYQFPNVWRTHVSGALPYRQTLTAYRFFKVFLNVNSVTDSPSMCARRVFEIAASGTPVVSTRSDAIHNFFDSQEVLCVSTPEEAEWTLELLLKSDILRQRTAQLALRKVWDQHTYRHRANAVLEQMGLSTSRRHRPVVSVICSTNRDTNLDHLLDQVAEQTYPQIELLVLGHGVQLEPDFKERAAQRGITKVSVLHREKDWSLGSCLNELVNASSGEIIAKFDDDDYYLPNYIHDQVNALINMNADLVGKAAHFIYFENSNTLALRRPEQQHLWRNFVAGATLVGWKAVFEQIPFADKRRGEDTEFLFQLEKSGFNVYSSDYFNYLCVRGRVAHTWTISDLEILASSEVQTFSKNLEHVKV